RMRNALLLLRGCSWAREQAGFSSRDRASAVEPNLPSPFLRGDTMKRTTGLCLTVGFILAVVFLFQLSTSASDASSSVTFSKDLASILHKNCASCHRAGEIAPMSLLSFKDVRPWAKSIREVVVERRM